MSFEEKPQIQKNFQKPKTWISNLNINKQSFKGHPIGVILNNMDNKNFNTADLFCNFEMEIL